MAQVSIARRYAKAILEVANDTQEADRVGDQLENLARIFKSHDELSLAFSHPGCSLLEKQAVLNKLIENTQSVPPVANMLKLLLQRGRLPLLEDIARIYRDLADERAGRVRGRVFSAVELPAETISRLASTLEKITRKQVVLEAKVDPALIGGVAAQVGPVVYDGSVKAQLEELRRTLRG